MKSSFPSQNQAQRAACMVTFADQGWYPGTQLLLVGNGQGLKITHIGCTSVYTSLGTHLYLTNVLCVSNITKNLIGISKLLLDNNIIVEFLSNMCFIKDKMKGTLLAQETAEGGLFKLLSLNATAFLSPNHKSIPSSMLSILFNNDVVNSTRVKYPNLCESNLF